MRSITLHSHNIIFRETELVGFDPFVPPPIDWAINVSPSEQQVKTDKNQVHNGFRCFTITSFTFYMGVIIHGFGPR